MTSARGLVIWLCIGFFAPGAPVLGMPWSYRPFGFSIEDAAGWIALGPADASTRTEDEMARARSFGIGDVFKPNE